MASEEDVVEELEIGAELTETTLGDLTIVGNIINSVGFVTGSLEYLTEQVAIANSNASNVQKSFYFLSKLPFLGDYVDVLLFGINKASEPLKSLDDALDEAGSVLNPVNTVLSNVGEAVFLSYGATYTANELYDVTLYALNNTDAVSASSLYSDESLAGLQWIHDQIASIQDSTQGARDALDVLNTDAYQFIAENIDEISAFFEGFNAVTGEISRITGEINKALEPVSWAFSASDDIQQALFGPIVDSVLEATGLQSLLDDFADQLDPFADFVSEFSDSLNDITVDSELFDVDGLVVAFWEPYSEIDVQIDAINNFGAFVFEAEDGSVEVIGSNNGELLTGTEFDDEFAPLRGDDTVDGLEGDDRVHYLHSIEQYRISLQPGDGEANDIVVAARDLAITEEGTDTLMRIERLNFNTPLSGDVLYSDIENFRYTTAEERNLTGDTGENWLFGDSENNSLSGEDGYDRLFGGSGNDVLDGGGGGDFVSAGEGNDTIYLDVSSTAGGVDTIDGGAGEDEVVLISDAGITVDLTTGGFQSGTGDIGVTLNVERFVATSFDDVFTLAEGAQEIITGGGNDQIFRVGEGDYVTATQGTTTMMSFLGGGFEGVAIALQGATSDNSFSVLAAVVNPDNNEEESRDFGRYGENVNVFEGTAFADVFYAYGASNSSNDGAKETFFFEYDGIDYELNGSVFFGNDGTDVFFASEFGSLFVGGDGYDIVNYNLDYTLANAGTGYGVRSLVINLSEGRSYANTNQGLDLSETYLFGIEGVVGTRSDDVIIGDENDNFLAGYQGSDEIHGGAGDDYIDGSNLIDATLTGGEGNDVFVLDAAEDASVDGGDGSDTLELKADQAFRLDVYFESQALGDWTAIQYLWYGWEVDLGEGTTSAHFSFEEEGTPNIEPSRYTSSLTDIENVLGSDRNDTIRGNAEDNHLNGRDGEDQLFGAQGDDYLYGDLGNDTLEGGDDNDLLAGGGGANQLDGGAGDDTLIASGLDDLTGGSGRDTFLIEVEGQGSIIRDFDPSEDVIALYGVDADYDMLSIVEIGGAVEISWEGQVLATVENIAATALTRDHFRFDIAARVDALIVTREGSDLIIGDPTQNDDASTEGGRLTITAIQDIAITVGSSVTLASGARVELGSDGILRLIRGDAYATLLPGETAIETITYEVTDENGRYTSSTIELQISEAVLNVEAENLAPVAVADETLVVTRGEDGTSVDLLANDTDPEGDSLSITGIPTATSGSVTVNGDGTLTYAANQDFVGDDIIYYQITDGTNVVDMSLAVSVISNGTVDGTGSDDTIDARFVDADGERISRADDTVNGFDGDDVLFGAKGRDVLNGGAGNDQLIGGHGQDSLLGDAGQDSLFGGVGADALSGGAGDDTLAGGQGWDLLEGEDGNDLLLGGSGMDTLNGGDGLDILGGGKGNDALSGNAGNDSLFGAAGLDTLHGGEGDDLLVGGSGADVLTGGLGADILFGGLGPDSFIFNSVQDSSLSATDTIHGFASNDLIELRQIDANAALEGDQAFSFIASAEFSGVAGELRFFAENGHGYIEADLDGDGGADFMIKLYETITLDSADLLL